VGLDTGSGGGTRLARLSIGDEGSVGRRSKDGRGGGERGSTGDCGTDGGAPRIGNSALADVCGNSSSDSEPVLGDSMGARGGGTGRPKSSALKKK
jgi:hypothetical protein